MRIENASASDVLERILSAYGFTMQKELAERLEIAKSNVAGWLQRGQVPGNVIVQCALDTGANVIWLVTGELENARCLDVSNGIKGKALYDEIMANGGRAVLRRVLDAYGFNTQKQLCDLLDISSGTVSTWVRRGYFPGDVVITCAIDTGTPLSWLATGKLFNEPDYDAKKIEKIKCWVLQSGSIRDDGIWICDKSLIRNDPRNLVLLRKNDTSWIIELGIKTLTSGFWLLEFDGVSDIYEVMRMPENKVQLKNDGQQFQCEIDVINIVGKAVQQIRSL